MCCYSDARGYTGTESYHSFPLDFLGRTTIVADSMGSATNTFDDLGRLTAVSNAFGRVEGRTYDLDDNPTNRVDANSVSAGIAYDLLHRPMSKTYPDGGIEGLFYNARGLLAHTNQLGNTTWYTLDGRRLAENSRNERQQRGHAVQLRRRLRPVDAARPEDQRHDLALDIYGRGTNKLGATSTTIIGYRLPSQGCHKSVALLEMFASRIVVDADNRLTNRWMKASGNTGYSYDAVGDLTNIAYPSQTVRFQYDALQERTNIKGSVLEMCS